MAWVALDLIPEAGRTPEVAAVLGEPWNCATGTGRERAACRCGG
jgi:hypothetical protein